MTERLDVHLLDSDTVVERTTKLSEAVNYAAEHRGPVVIWHYGERIALVVPPDAGLAWARAGTEIELGPE